MTTTEAQPTTLPACPDWCTHGSVLDHTYLDESADGRPMRWHTIEYPAVEASRDVSPRTGHHPDVFVCLQQSETATPDGLSRGELEIGVAADGYPHFTADEARRLAATLTAAADKLDELTNGDVSTRDQGSCPEWCDREHLEDDEEALHSRVIAEGHETKTHGPLYRVELEEGSNGLTKLWVEVNGLTMTVNQAEVLGRAVLEGAAILGSAHPDPSVALTGYHDGHRWVRVDSLVYPATPAEQRLAEGPLESATPEPGDVAAVRGLLELMTNFVSDDQRARYLLSSNWLRDRGAAAAQRLQGA